jgi:signal transduction histidine kinase/ActR/RegA family two-component response regulator
MSQAVEMGLLPKLSALVDLVRDISQARSAEETYDPALSALSAIVGVERSSILLLDAKGVARFVAWRGLSAVYRAAVEGHFPWALDDPAPQPIVVTDTARDQALAPFVSVFAAEHIQAIAFIPLVYGDRLVGKFMLYFDEPHELSREELELANAVAYLVAFAIQRARLVAALKEADERKDTFLATLAHELRNPLAPASAALEVIAQRSSDPVQVAKAHDVLDRSIRKIVKLVDDLLDVSRITHGVISLEKEPLDLTSIVHHAIAPVEATIRSQRQELTLSLEPLWVEADGLRLEQVITNLLHNASKYTPPGGHLRVVTRAADGGVEIRVQDDGIGVAPELIPHLFDLFVQADKSLARSRGGLGIGLTLVRQLVELHGGTVIAESAGEGSGSTFIVWLPRRIEKRAPSSLPSSQVQHVGPRRRVLVVDDNEDAAMMLATVLEGWGHDVTTVGTGPDALHAVDEWKPELVLLDLGLPGMSGYEVAQHLRASGHSALRIVAVSGYGQPSDAARSRAAGVDAHLAKPVALDVLERIVRDGPRAAA